MIEKRGVQDEFKGLLSDADEEHEIHIEEQEEIEE